MAIPGTGYRNVLSVMLEISFHLLEPIISTTLTSAVSASGSATVTVGSLGIPSNALYIGAQVVVDTGVNQETVTVTYVNESASAFTASFIFTHAIGAPVMGATFPVQASSGDYFFSQSEIQSYLARAQNQFLADVPSIFALNTQFVQIGNIYQQLVCDAITMERVASSSQYVTLSSINRLAFSGYGVGGYGVVGNVQAVSQSPHGLILNQKFSIFNTLDPSFVGAFTVTSVVDAYTFNYIQNAPAGNTTGGAAILWTRLYETSQEELSIQDPFWRNQNITRLSNWFEDRTGNYQWGVNGRPASQFPVEVLVTARDTDTLAMTDGFLVPDIMLHFVTLKALRILL